MLFASLAWTAWAALGALFDSDEAAPPTPEIQVETQPTPESASHSEELQLPSEPPAIHKEAEATAPSSDLDDLRQRNLQIPVQGVKAKDLIDSFDDPRSGGRLHRALDISAPRNTPVLAVDDGVITRIAENRLGGLAITQHGSEGRYSFYYAHLERYARGLEEGDRVRRGQVIGYVGSSGNAPDHVPHLHFAVYPLGPDQRRRGQPLNPWALWRTSTDSE